MLYPTEKIRVHARKAIQEFVGPGWFGENYDDPPYPPMPDTNRAPTAETVADACRTALRAAVTTAFMAGHDFNEYTSTLWEEHCAGKDAPDDADERTAEFRASCSLAAPLAEGCYQGLLDFCSKEDIDPESLRALLKDELHMLNSVRREYYYVYFAGQDPETQVPAVQNPDSYARLLSLYILNCRFNRA